MNRPISHRSPAPARLHPGRTAGRDPDHRHPGRAARPGHRRAIRTAKNAAVIAEINQLAQALADFKNKYGDYPPSRIILCEDGILAARPGLLGDFHRERSPTSPIRAARAAVDHVPPQVLAAGRRDRDRARLTSTRSAGANWLRLQRQRRPRRPVHPRGARVPRLLPRRHPVNDRPARSSGFAEEPVEPVHQLDSRARPTARRPLYRVRHRPADARPGRRATIPALRRPARQQDRQAIASMPTSAPTAATGTTRTT